jgi:hypothetical protein
VPTQTVVRVPAAVGPRAGGGLSQHEGRNNHDDIPKRRETSNKEIGLVTAVIQVELELDPDSAGPAGLDRGHGHGYIFQPRT